MARTPRREWDERERGNPRPRHAAPPRQQSDPAGWNSNEEQELEDEDEDEDEDNLEETEDEILPHEDLSDLSDSTDEDEDAL